MISNKSRYIDDDDLAMWRLCPMSGFALTVCTNTVSLIHTAVFRSPHGIWILNTININHPHGLWDRFRIIPYPLTIDENLFRNVYVTWGRFLLAISSLFTQLGENPPLWTLKGSGSAGRSISFSFSVVMGTSVSNLVHIPWPSAS